MIVIFGYNKALRPKKQQSLCISRQWHPTFKIGDEQWLRDQTPMGKDGSHHGQLLKLSLEKCETILPTIKHLKIQNI
jgi:hypothetical protein